ncbi:hypothetical protein EH32_05905 [Erythrobacter litoralis]|uniref:Uncharacterized protein n=1 Tax=Erythrobacter litoralis TaxID=39960 RepID=A0A074MUG0_9SPHN|nr:hypothetical protein EH32_05905 [Erythrobacter litoralis]
MAVARRFCVPPGSGRTAPCQPSASSRTRWREIVPSPAKTASRAVPARSSPARPGSSSERQSRVRTLAPSPRPSAARTSATASSL